MLLLHSSATRRVKCRHHCLRFIILLYYFHLTQGDRGFRPTQVSTLSTCTTNLTSRYWSAQHHELSCIYFSYKETPICPSPQVGRKLRTTSVALEHSRYPPRGSFNCCSNYCVSGIPILYSQFKFRS